MKRIIQILTLLILFSCSENESKITILTSQELQIDSILYCYGTDCDGYSVCQYNENGNITSIHRGDKVMEDVGMIYKFLYFSDSLVIEYLSIV